MSYTLEQYYKESGVECEMEFAKEIVMKFNPDTHQKTGLNRALAEAKFGLYDECDTGKTCVMQAYSMFYASQGFRVVGVMLPVLVGQFHDSLFDTFNGAEKHFTVHQYSQPPAKRKALREQWKKEDKYPDILLVSYTMFAKEYQHFIDMGYQVYLADECDMMCNPETLANKAMQICTEHEDTPLLQATGTPNRKELLDCYGLIKLNNPDAYQSKGHFERVHVEYFKNPETKQKIILGYENEDLITRNLYAKARRVTKQSIGRSATPRVTLLPIELSAEHYALYKKVLKERILEVDGEMIDGVTAQALRNIAMRIVVTPEMYTDKGKKMRNNVFDALDTLLLCAETADRSHENKAILFAHYNSTVELLLEHYKHLNPAVMYGKNKSKQPAEMDKFKTDDSCRILIANAISAGVGVDGFQKVCCKEIFVEPQATPRTFIQSVERINRRGQKYTCSVHILNVLRTLYPIRLNVMLDRNDRIKKVNMDKTSFLDELYGIQ